MHQPIERCVMQFNLNDSHQRLVKSIVVTKTQYTKYCFVCQAFYNEKKFKTQNDQKGIFRFYLCFECSFKWYIMLRQQKLLDFAVI